MKRRYPKNLNHSRVETYKVTHNPRYNNFLISKDYIHERELKFIYNENGTTVEKIIPMAYLGPHLQQKMFFHKDEFLLKRVFRGTAYSVKQNIVFNY